MSLQTAATTPATGVDTGTDHHPKDKAWIKVLGLGFGIPVAIALMLLPSWRQLQPQDHTT
ncbi:hypothetical protein N24_2805 [Corynebacterium suranareeae]|uniref:Uncharacterized protein n=1 Tax=Corynebacterium suranareeae TaxID=2506452 RepID=A0A160PS29_9CORY|nr:hypothetical protein [Corynebacterium suranareeae]BAU97067.1 hypothetical protein N24_2805 [Corynebacterium suranareeae]